MSARVIFAYSLHLVKSFPTRKKKEFLKGTPIIINKKAVLFTDSCGINLIKEQDPSSFMATRGPKP